MRVLAFDVSVTGCSVSIYDTETEFSCQNRVETDRGQAEMLVPMIEQIASQSGTNLQQIGCIAVTRGPGSFTGVRIGLATGRALGLALNCPVFGFSTLDVIARSHEENAETLFLIDTKRGDYYGQIGAGAEAKIWGVEDVENFKGVVIKDAIPDVVTLAKMAADQYGGESGYDMAKAPTPLYLRGAEISQSKRETPQVCFTDLE